MDELKIVEDHSDETESSTLMRKAGERPEENNVQENVKLIVADDSEPRDTYRQESYQEEPKKSKNRRPLNTRPQHAQLSGFKDIISAKDQEIANLRNALDQRGFEVQQAQQMAMQRDRVSFANHEYALQVKKQEAKRSMAEAMDAGDTEKAADANEAMVDVSTQLARLEDLKNAPQFEPQQMEMAPSYNYPEPRQYDDPVETEQDLYEQLEQEELREEDLERKREEVETAREFLRENPWADPNSDNYDRRLHIKFALRANKARDANLLEGNVDYANGKEILDDVVQEILEETNKSKGNRLTSTQRSSSMVSPVSRGGGYSNRGSADDRTISKAEYDAVSRLPEIMKEKDVNKLGLEYLRIKKGLQVEGKLGHGLQPRHQTYNTSSTNSRGY